MFMLSTGLQRLSPLFRRSMSTSLPSQPDLRVVAAAGLVGGGFGGLSPDGAALEAAVAAATRAAAGEADA